MSTVAVVITVILVFFLVGVLVGVAVVYALSARRAATTPPDPGGSLPGSSAVRHAPRGRPGRPGRPGRDGPA